MMNRRRELMAQLAEPWGGVFGLNVNGIAYAVACDGHVLFAFQDASRPGYSGPEAVSGVPGVLRMLRDASNRDASHRAEIAALKRWAKQAPSECTACSGSGMGPSECSECSGDGALECECQCCGNVHERDCDACGGSGEIQGRGEACSRCRGSGNAPRFRAGQAPEAARGLVLGELIDKRKLLGVLEMAADMSAEDCGVVADRKVIELVGTGWVALVAALPPSASNGSASGGEFNEWRTS